jgi:hypothetical protein
MSLNLINILKLFLAILLFVCLLDLPYGYYQLVRFIALIGFSILAYDSNTSGNKKEVIIFLSLAILFQPLIKIALGREIWNVVDLVVGVGLITNIFLSRTK